MGATAEIWQLALHVPPTCIALARSLLGAVIITPNKITDESTKQHFANLAAQHTQHQAHRSLCLV